MIYHTISNKFGRKKYKKAKEKKKDFFSNTKCNEWKVSLAKGFKRLD